MPVQSLPTGIDLYYETHGAGEALVLIPGTGFAADVWRPYQVPELSKSLQLVTFDPRGVGRSSHYEGVYTIDQMGCDVIALMDHLGIASAHVLGHSMGGRIALWMALSFPGRVTSLILAASGSGPVARPGELCVPGLSHDYLVRLMNAGFEQHLRHSIMESSNYFSQEFRAQHPDLVEAAYELTRNNHAGLSETLRQTIARDDWEATHRLGELRVPTLVVIGTADRSGASHLAQAQVLRDRIPGAEYRELAGLSHGFFWEAPEETNAWILDWVTRHSGVRER